MIGVHLNRRVFAGTTALALGALAGVAVGLFGVGGAAAQRQAEPALPPLLEATHLPPLLTARGEPVELRYDVFCGAGDEEAASRAECDASGTAFVRAGDAGRFEQIPLRVDASASEGRYVAAVPSAIAQSPDGFSYYATFRDGSSGVEISSPPGAGDAPERSLPLGRSVDVHLGRHVFGRIREPDAVVVRAAWGDGPDQVGLEQGRNLTPIGGSSFDVDRAGNVTVLDETHKRLLRFAERDGVTSRTPLAVDGTIADMAVADDGKIYVLDSSSPSPKPLLRAFEPDGSALGSVESAERAAQVRLGPAGPVLLQEPSDQWMDAAAGGRLLAPDSQRKSGRSGRPLPGGGDVVVLRRGNEIRVATVSGHRVVRSWRVTSETPIAEVQLAEPRGAGLVLVARVYTDDQDEFVVLVLDAKRLVRSFSLDSADWAETAPLSKFRLVGSSLYQLGSTAAGLFVDRFELEGN